MIQAPQITFHGFPRSNAIEEYVRKRADKLDTFYDRVQSCRIAVEAPHQHKREGNPYRIRIDVVVPGSEIVVSRDVGGIANEDVYSTVDEAFDEAGRRLQDFARVQRGDVKTHERSRHGVVHKLWSYEGYGFIRTEEGDELYFHKNSVLHGAFNRLSIGARVRFNEEEGEDGLHASVVALVRGPGKRAAE